MVWSTQLTTKNITRLYYKNYTDNVIQIMYGFSKGQSQTGKGPLLPNVCEETTLITLVPPTPR